jgi:dCMP deaminase
MAYSRISRDLGSIIRPSVDEYFLLMAQLVGSRSTCARRRVGCVLVNRYNHVIATGYNGVAAGVPHCIDKPCAGAGLPSGQGLHLCQAIHAEQNAIMQCRDITTIYKAYVTASPCIQCTRLLLGTACQEVVFIEEYPHSESRALWVGLGRHWSHRPFPIEQLQVIK